MLTFSVAAFVTVVVKLLLGGITLTLGAKVFTVASIDASQIGALLTPTLGAYVARRYTDKKHAEPVEPEKQG